jgi:prepilin-type N-terminal cleavage/methylation domain-containing protein
MAEPRHSDRGFTLVEVLVVIAVLGVLITALASTIVVILRTTPSTETRIDDARTTRGLVTWLTQDVMSTPLANGFSAESDTVAPPCKDSKGDRLIRMRWTELDKQFVADYRLVRTGSTSVITRYTCSGNPLANTSTIRLTSGLSNNPSQQKIARVGKNVEVRLTGQSGLTVAEFNIASRNPVDE